MHKLLFSILISLFLGANFLSAKSFYFDNIRVQAEVQRNGDIKIEEWRTYSFKGSFSWADYELNLRPNMQILDFSISENNSALFENDSEDNGSYSTESSVDRFYAKWHYKARNEQRTFKLNYVLTNVVNVYDDIAELYFKFIGENNPRYVNKVHIQITLPESAEFGPVHAWAHGPLWGNVAFEKGKIILNVQDLPKNQFVEARLTFPLEWVPEAQLKIPELAHGRIMAEEGQYAEKANERRRQAEIDRAQSIVNNEMALDYAIPLSLAGLLVFLFLFYRDGRPFTVNFAQTMDTNIPKDKHPALLNCIYWNNQVSGSTLATTLFGLAQKGYIKIEQDSGNNKKWYDAAEPVIIKLEREKWQNDRQKLLDFENDLVEFLFNTIDGPTDEITSRKMKKASSKLHKWFTKWRKKVKEHLKEPAYYEKNSIKATTISAVFNVIIIVGGIALLIFLGKNGALALISGIVLTGLSFTILRYTPEIKLLKKKLSALRNYLKKYSRQNSHGSENLSYISDYFLFAIALGLGKKIMNNLVSIVPAEQHATYFPWFYYAAGSGNPADFATAVTSVVNAAATSVSSAAGAGGGMSGGAGGGAGGASGGAG